MDNKQHNFFSRIFTSFKNFFTRIYRFLFPKKTPKYKQYQPIDTTPLKEYTEKDFSILSKSEILSQDVIKENRYNIEEQIQLEISIAYYIVLDTAILLKEGIRCTSNINDLLTPHSEQIIEISKLHSFLELLGTKSEHINFYEILARKNNYSIDFLKLLKFELSILSLAKNDFVPEFRNINKYQHSEFHADITFLKEYYSSKPSRYRPTLLGTYTNKCSSFFYKARSALYTVPLTVPVFSALLKRATNIYNGPDIKQEIQLDPTSCLATSTPQLTS